MHFLHTHKTTYKSAASACIQVHSESRSPDGNRQTFASPIADKTSVFPQGYEADDKCAWHNLYPGPSRRSRRLQARNPHQALPTDILRHPAPIDEYLAQYARHEAETAQIAAHGRGK